jgi:superfamily I DNA/RNA helicase
MSRKKKEVDNFVPSKYQTAIFDQILHGSGHIVVEAAAGAGKTTTLIKCLELIPEDKKILMAAFNRDIVEELTKKTKKFENVEVKTLHGLGFTMIKRNLPTISIVPEPFKYESHIRNFIRDYTTINLRRLSPKDYFKYMDNIKKYVDFGRFYLCQTEKDLEFIETRYGIETFADEKSVALKVMEWGKNHLEDIDYTDMVWLPHVLNLKPLGLLYDFIMVDECQDMNKAERELVLKCFKMGTRLISIGDRNQCLYSFAGADPESFNKILSIPNTTCLPLSISYRCGRNIVDYAKQIVPSIEWNEAGGREGKVLYNVPLDMVEDGDMILCRNNAPLIQVYNEFLKIGKKAFIRGKDIGSNLKKLVMSTKQDVINADCRSDGLFARLYDDLFTTRNNIMVRSGIDAQTALKSPIIENKMDMIKALEILSEGINQTDELIKRIDEIFPKGDKKGTGIALSTIHKAKGLEANNVYIVCPSLMPSKAAQKDWEIRQEQNLMYVAYTRAKDTLGFIDEKDFQDFDATNANSTSKLARIEYQVNRILGKSTTTIINENSARAIIANAKPVEKRIPTSSTISMNSSRGINSFNDIFRNKKNVKIRRR